MLLGGLLVGIILLLGVTIPALSSDSGEMPDWHVIAGGELMFVQPADFGLAVHWDQLLVKSMIPPCDDGFDYCIYYYGDDFAGTNFRSAGVRSTARGSGHGSSFFSPRRGGMSIFNRRRFARETTLQSAHLRRCPMGPWGTTLTASSSGFPLMAECVSR